MCEESFGHILRLVADVLTDCWSVVPIQRAVLKWGGIPAAVSVVLAHRVFSWLSWRDTLKGLNTKVPIFGNWHASVRL